MARCAPAAPLGQPTGQSGEPTAVARGAKDPRSRAVDTRGASRSAECAESRAAADSVAGAAGVKSATDVDTPAQYAVNNM